MGDIDEERRRQIKIFGDDRHDPIEWFGILAEEHGEVSKAIIENYDWKNHRFKLENQKEALHYREELVQVAAVCVAMIEDLDRKLTEKYTREMENGTRENGNS